MDAPTPPDPPESTPPRRVPTPRGRYSALLAAAMLGIGIAVGAAIGPAPQSSLGEATGLAQRLPLLIAGIASHRSATTPTTTSETQPPAVVEEPTPAKAAKKAKRKAAGSSGTGESTEASGNEETSGAKGGSETKKKLPAVTSVWLIELSGTSFEYALAQSAAAPYINGQLLGAATLLEGWSAPDAVAFAGEATVAETPAAGSSPPLLRTIVQPPCPEGAAGASCAPETPGQLTAADEFLKATLTSITATSAYREHGLIVITFADVGIATQSELPAGASTSTSSYQPPAGVALLSPFVTAGKRATTAYDPTSPRQSLEKLLH